jgi:hypothetical protein
MTTAGNSTAAGATAPIGSTAAVAGLGTAVPQSGPYDPNAYRTAAATAAPASAPTTTAGAADRYGNAPAMSPADRYGSPLATNPPATSTGSFSHGTPSTAAPAATAAASADRYGILPVTGSTTSAAAQPSAVPATPNGIAQTPSRYDVTPPIAAETPAQNGGVQVTASAGQYRPGGTSNYEGPNSHVEVAIRPAASAAAPATGTTIPPAGYPATQYGGQQPY